jgi:hypothetical protein
VEYRSLTLDDRAEDNDRIYDELLGFGREEIAGLRASGVI